MTTAEKNMEWKRNGDINTLTRRWFLSTLLSGLGSAYAARWTLNLPLQ
jgi:hypothetical protein